MCGRYAMAVSPQDLPEYFGQNGLTVDQVESSNYDSAISYNIGPTRYAPVYYFRVDQDSGNIQHIAQYANWGLVPHWTKSSKDAQPWKRFNAKKESLASGIGLWKSSANHKRCVVPMQGYYEWLHKPIKGTKKVDKIPYYIKRKDNKLIYLAGLRDGCKYEDGEGELFHTFTIITGPSPKQLHWLHERMPIVLTPGTKEFDTWLDPEIKEFGADLLNCLDIYNKDDLEWYEVSQEVNKYSSSGPQLIEPKKDTQKGIMSFMGKPKKEVNSEVVHKDASEVEPQQQEVKKEYARLKKEEADDVLPNGSEKGTYKYKSRKSSSPQKSPKSDQKKKRSIVEMMGGESVSSRVKREKT